MLTVMAPRTGEINCDEFYRTMKAKSGRGVMNPQQQRHDNHNSWTVSYCGGGCCRGQQLLCKSRHRILNLRRLPDV